MFIDVLVAEIGSTTTLVNAFDISVDNQAGRTIGIITQPSVPDNQSGYVTTIGFVRGVNTSAFGQGNILYDILEKS